MCACACPCVCVGLPFIIVSSAQFSLVGAYFLNATTKSGHDNGGSDEVELMSFRER